MNRFPAVPSVAESEDQADLFDLDNEDLVDEIMDGHTHLLDQPGDMEQLDPYMYPAPTPPKPVIHTGPPAAKPVPHTSSAAWQYADPSSPPSFTTLTPAPRRVKTSSALRPSGYHTPTRQDLASCEDVPRSSSYQQSRQQYPSRRTSAPHNHALSRQGSEQGTQKHHDELSHKMSNLSLRDHQQFFDDRGHHRRSSFFETPQPGPYPEQTEGPSRHRGLSQHVNYHTLPSIPQCSSGSGSAAATRLDHYADQTSSTEWEDEDDEHEYEEVTVHRTKTASNGNEPEVSTNQNLKYTSLVWAESSAKIMYLCGRKMYEIMWTSETSQRLRSAAMHRTRKASGQAADSLGRFVVDSCKGSLGGVKHFVSHRCSVLKAVRRSPQEAVRVSAIRSLRRLSRMKLAGVPVPVSMLGLPEVGPESDIEENYDFCDEDQIVEHDQPSNANVASPGDDYNDDDSDVPSFLKDDIYGPI